MTVTLSAESKYGFSGQYIARILGRAAKFQFNREFVGSKSGKRLDVSSYTTDEPGLYETCDVTKHGKEKAYLIVMPWKDDLRKLASDTEDALAIAKRLDSGEALEQIVALELEPMNETKYAVRCTECKRDDLVDGHCPDHPEAPVVNSGVEVPKLKEDGTRAHRLVYAIRKPGEAKKAEAAATLDAAVDAIVNALQALPAAQQKQALKLAKDRLFPKATETTEPTEGSP